MRICRFDGTQEAWSLTAIRNPNSNIMSLSLNLSDRFSSLNKKIYFFKKHLMIVMRLGLTAAFGRVIQLGGSADSSSKWTILLFFKHLTLILLTLIFDTVLLL